MEFSKVRRIQRITPGVEKMPGKSMPQSQGASRLGLLSGDENGDHNHDDNNDNNKNCGMEGLVRLFLRDENGDHDHDNNDNDNEDCRRK